MKRSMLVVMAMLLALSGPAAQAQTEEQRALRSRIEDRFDVVPLTGGIALRPKSAMRDVRLIEVSDGVIAINGTPVTGRELRERIGADADTVLRLSYLAADDRRELFGGPGASAMPRRNGRGAASETPDAEGRRRPSGQRVRIFGNVTVDEDEIIRGDAVAVLGSVRVNGEVGGQVVAVMGSVDVGPKAVINGEVVSVGGRVRRAPGAELRGDITEVAVGSVFDRFDNVHVPVGPWFTGAGPWMNQFAIPELMGSTFRLFLLLMFGAIAFVLARGSVDGSAQRVSDNTPKALLVGLAAELLFAPVLALTALVLAVSIVGIPLLLLLPFAVLALILMAIAGFAGTAAAFASGARRRLGLGAQPGFVDVLVGIVLILSPLLIGRFIAIGGGPAEPFAWLLVTGGIAFEFLAWTTGFGAVLMNSFARWRARRAARTPAPVPAA
ncbi:MAG TPA: polymer-forming cytoskeletal protein [Vicinamibacterales bacterium]|jgi:hypothetical protein|nr:polymer-forming cytoskeletal protein [Vicinamibacterales bacterium]